jgi:hypothetical protein
MVLSCWVVFVDIIDCSTSVLVEEKVDREKKMKGRQICWAG